MSGDGDSMVVSDCSVEEPIVAQRSSITGGEGWLWYVLMYVSMDSMCDVIYWVSFILYSCPSLSFIVSCSPSFFLRVSYAPPCLSHPFPSLFLHASSFRLPFLLPPDGRGVSGRSDRVLAYKQRARKVEYSECCCC